MPPLTDDLMNGAVSSAGDIQDKPGQSTFFSRACIPMALTCGALGLVIGGLVVFVLYKCRCDKGDSQGRPSLQNELQKKDKELDDKDDILKNLKRELEEQRDRLRGQLEDIETEREKNKRERQSVEMELTEREKSFDKPEELLKEKEKLLNTQWKLEETKKIYERQLLDTEKMLEPIENHVTEGNRRSSVHFWLDEPNTNVI